MDTSTDSTSTRPPGKSKSALRKMHDKIFNPEKYKKACEKEKARSQRRRDDLKKQRENQKVTRELSAQIEKEKAMSR